MFAVKNHIANAIKSVDDLYAKAAVGALVLCASAAASAQSTDPFDTALATATTKTGSYAAALVGLSAVAVVFMIAMKYVKRIPRAS